MHSLTTDAAESIHLVGSGASWTAVFTLGVAAFALVTTEFLPVGLLPSIATDLGQSEGRTGLMVTLPGLLAAIAAPCSVAFIGSIDRRKVLISLLALLVASNLIVALSEGFGLLLAGRLLMGLAVGGFWTIGGSLGPRLRPGEGAKAGAVIMSGVSLGTVAGVPAGALLGDLLGWRWVFGVACVMSLAVLVLLVVLLPRLPAQSNRGLRDVPKLLSLPKVRLGMGVILLVFLGQFAAYTYISPFLLRVTGVDAALVSGVLLAYGVAGFVGNLLGGWAVSKSARGSLIGTALALASAMLMLALLGSGFWWSLGLSMLWGMAFGMLPLAMQTWLFDAAPKQLEAVQAMFVSLAQVAIGGGALAGGLLVDHLGVTSVMWFAALAAAITAILMAVGARDRTASTPHPTCAAMP